jgi:hypothetical protein
MCAGFCIRQQGGDERHVMGGLFDHVVRRNAPGGSQADNQQASTHYMFPHFVYPFFYVCDNSQHCTRP